MKITTCRTSWIVPVTLVAERITSAAGALVTLLDPLLATTV